MPVKKEALVERRLIDKIIRTKIGMNYSLIDMMASSDSLRLIFNSFWFDKVENFMRIFRSYLIAACWVFLIVPPTCKTLGQTSTDRIRRMKLMEAQTICRVEREHLTIHRLVFGEKYLIVTEPPALAQPNSPKLALRLSRMMVTIMPSFKWGEDFSSDWNMNSTKR